VLKSFAFASASAMPTPSARSTRSAAGLALHEADDDAPAVVNRDRADAVIAEVMDD
jgi:hypothetical protein